MRTTKKAATMAVTAVLGLGTGVALATTGGGDGEGTPATWHPEPAGAPAPATAAQKAAFGILAAAPGADDPDRAALRTLAERAGIGLDADGARVVGTTGHGPAWLVPAAGGLCLAVEDTGDGAVGVACEGEDDVVARGTTVGDGTSIYGVAPDGVDAVTVTPASGGAARSVAVSADGFYTLPSEDATIALGGPGGDVSFAVAG